MANTENYDALLKRRLGIIKDQGSAATASAQNLANIQQAGRLAQEQEGLNTTLKSATPYTPTGGKDFNSFFNAIRSQESGGNYGSVNKDSGALGAYQIMPSNVRGWAQEAGLGNVSNQKFLGSAQIQNQVAKYKLQQYYNMYGAAGAAVAWYAGPGAAKKYVAAGGKGYNGKQGNYPSISGYAASVLRKMGY